MDRFVDRTSADKTQLSSRARVTSPGAALVKLPTTGFNSGHYSLIHLAGNIPLLASFDAFIDSVDKTAINDKFRNLYRLMSS